ncbi:universal stress protein [Hydrogenophaga sp.]|uniref:universal stress protein n=1 Tax=Hydrogenophaga sp. TaxID=1904254 RepID=UPI003D11DE88
MNPYPSILLHIDSSERTAERVRLARALAEDFDAEVTAQPCMLTALARYPYALEGAAAAMKLMQELDRECLDKAQAVFNKAAAGSSRLRWAPPLADGPWGFARRALYADLVILGQRNADDPASGELPADFLPTVLVESGRPALILPYVGTLAAVGRTVLVAWKETPESARAVSCAMPWLLRATRVHLIGFGESASDSLHALQRYLSAQGVTATPHVGGAEESDVGNQLLSRAADLGADLLVMGCYGHSRAREWVMGGATRTILRTMTLPVLMTH